MANGFDRRGALVGAAILVVVLLVAAALIWPPHLSITVNLPPAQRPSSQ